MCVEPLTVVEAALATDVAGAAAVPPWSSVQAPQGLLMCLALMMRGVEVHVLDVNEERLAFAGRLGAVIEPSDRQVRLS